MASEFGDVFIAAIAAAISPVPIIAAILILFSDHSRRNGILYLLGWVIGMLICIGAVLLLPEDLDFKRGAVLASGGCRFQDLYRAALRRRGACRVAPAPQDEGRRTRCRRGQTGSRGSRASRRCCWPSGWRSSTPRTWRWRFRPSFRIAEAGALPRQARLALALFVFIGSVTIAVPVFYRLVAGKQADKQLQVWKEWLMYNNATVVCVVLLMMGVMIIGKGVGGFL